MKPTTDDERIDLLHRGLRCALDAIRGEADNALKAAAEYPTTFNGMLWGDHTDYTNAAADQISWILARLQGNEPLTDLDELFTLTRAELLDDPERGNGFIIGYADHSSPISDLMAANREED